MTRFSLILIKRSETFVKNKNNNIFNNQNGNKTYFF